jgi:hypothetical protein
MHITSAGNFEVCSYDECLCIFLRAGVEMHCNTGIVTQAPEITQLHQKNKIHS